MMFRRANGVLLHLADHGPRAAPVLVATNSLGTDLRIWDEVLDPLTDRFRVIRADKRGHGLSEMPPGPASIADYAADLAALLDTLGVGRATVIGLSIGGLIAQALAAARPDLVRSLIFCDTAHKIGTTASWNARMDAIAAGGIESIADAILERWFAASYRAANPDALAGWRTMLVRTPTDGYRAACAALRDADYTDVARAIAVPTLCVVGDQDGSTPPDLVKSFADLIPGARYHVIDEAGHLPNIEQPAALRALIEAHWESLG